MTVDDLIAELRSASGPHRRFDTAIARLLGYRKISLHEDGKATEMVWIAPDGSKKEPPYFTLHIDAAKEFADNLLPDAITGVAWGGGGSPSAGIGAPANAKVIAASPALALCIAVLETVNQRMNTAKKS